MSYVSTYIGESGGIKQGFVEHYTTIGTGVEFEKKENGRRPG